MPPACNPFLSWSGYSSYGLAKYTKYGTNPAGLSDSGVCIPDLGSDTTPLTGASALACGSGQKMVLEATITSSSRNNTPWDLPDGTNGYQGSLYFGAQVAETWQAGVGHYIGTPSPVETGTLTWASDYVEMDGFGNGYGGSLVAGPGTAINMQIFDSVWGQPNLYSDGGALIVLAEEPAQYADAGWFWYGDPTAQASYLVTELLGSNSCGLTNHVVGPLPIGDAVLTISMNDAGDSWSPSPTVTTDENGNVLMNFTPNSGGQKAITFTAENGLAETLYSYVLPVATHILPNRGPVAGGQNVSVSGKYLLTGTPAQIFRFQADAGLSYATNVAVVGNGQSATATTPKSPIPSTINGGVGDVLVVADGNPVDGGQGTTGVTYTYIIPGKPYVTYYPSCTCDAPNCTFTVYDADGGIDPSVGSISVSGSGVTFGTHTVRNGGTTTCAFQADGGANESITAWVTGTNADGGSVTTGKQFACPAHWNCFYPPLLWEGPFSSLPHDEVWVSLHAQQIFVQAHGGDYWDFFQPQIYSWTSGFSFSSFTPRSLGIESMWALKEKMAGEVSASEVIPASSSPGTKYTHLCFTGQALDVGLNVSGSPNWSFTVAYPLPFPDVASSSYRVFGLTTAGNGPTAYWSEMSSSIQGSKIVASDFGGSTGYGDYITGPYALAYWSQTSCGAGN